MVVREGSLMQKERLKLSSIRTMGRLSAKSDLSTGLFFKRRMNGDDGTLESCRLPGYNTKVTTEEFYE
uniref:Ovule protein n=1 Tax=Heterorhabditis bacteriophora TaxID=37862 RepID=A0A1I7WQ49_HETBA